MPRAKGGYKTKHRRNRIRKAAKGFRGGRSKPNSLETGTPS